MEEAPGDGGCGGGISNPTATPSATPTATPSATPEPTFNPPVYQPTGFGGMGGYAVAPPTRVNSTGDVPEFVKTYLRYTNWSDYTLKNTAYTHFYYTPFNTIYCSPIEGYCTVGIAPGTVRVFEFTKNKTMRCEKNAQLPIESWNWIFDYSGECN
jgi:hypothetical protein